MMAKSAVSTVSILPANCAYYSGQKLMGAWSDTPQNSVEFFDRIVARLDQYEELPGRGPRRGAHRRRRDSTRQRERAHRGLRDPIPYSPDADADRAGRAARRIVPDGVDELLPRRGPGTHRDGVGLRDRAAPGDQRPVRRVRRRHRLRHGRRTSTRSRAVSGGVPTEDLLPGAPGVPADRRDPSTCATGGSGGTGRPARAGVIRSVRTARSTRCATGPIIPSCRSPTPTRRPTRAGRAGGCRRRRSGSTPRVAGPTTTYPWGDDVMPGAS